MGIEDDTTKVNTTSIYFTNVALLWWRRRSMDEKHGGIAIETWELKPWEKHELGRQRITELTIAITEVESFVELGPRKDKFETSKPKETGNGGGDHEEERDKNDNGDNGEDDPDKEIMRLGSIMSGVEVKKVKESGKKQVDCFFCNGPHRMRDCLEQSKLSTISKGEKVELDESKTSMLGSMILSSAKRNNKYVGLMFVDINIPSQKSNALVDMGASDLFISEKAAGKLSHSIIKSTKKIKTVNSEEVPTVGVARGVELQIGEWKGKEDFEVIHLDDYDFVLGLNFLYRIKVFLFPFFDCIHIFDDLQQRCVVPVNQDMRVRTKLLSIIQLV
ncbi:hypothetical protein Golax_014243 [Gossypium laxum]|uniref:Aspartic peptidase DDI1-type domain-containing protein n=1 Tax=Gossypium laxum TaxID=34288 RepID=A0A7J8ZUI8_9ROSI|nr:hypothetical protein [Gossypium laxum]